MKVKDPAKTADEIVDTYNSRDPERIAKLCGILIKEVDWDKQSGAYTEILRQPVIFISKNLRRSMRSVVIAHELGHHFLHKKKPRRSAASRNSRSSILTRIRRSRHTSGRLNTRR